MDGKIARTLVGALGIVLLFDTVRMMVLKIPGGVFIPIDVPFWSLTLILAALALWFAACGHIASQRAQLKRTLLFGVVVGIFALFVGVIGAMIVRPSAQSPLFGLFVAGPVGFVLGCVAGLLWGRFDVLRRAR